MLPRIFIALLCSLLLSATAFCAEEGQSLLSSAAAEAATDVKEYHFWDEFLNMILALAFIVTLIMVTSSMLKRLSRNRMHQANSANLIKVLERRALTPKSSIYLIEVAGKAFVIADSAAGVQPLTELPLGTDLEEVSPTSKGGALKFSFREIIQRKLRQSSAENAPTASENSSKE